ncbi:MULTISPECIES: UbiA family prenyltransferase [Rufibacter]|uniref:4-hydroxybenzoate polyprenyltransferase n=1 Tax=Rufibacter quisquiliarum TaxID=1549639 RepID=A0A839GP32_9BACT|nr:MULTISPECIES: UbiA family prenyltransferase [Rufibacter]MBA9076198.1 4-hydroxybenzoate polyprenyltransferase [Rufibacter quisquiliarum]
MRFALNTLNFILYSNVFISVCATGLVWETYLLNQMPISLRMGGIVFFATLFVYNIDSLLPYKFNQDVPLTPRTEWIQSNRLVLMSVALASALCTFTLYWTSLFDLNFWFLLHLVVVAGLYSVPVIPDRENYIPLRDIPLLKVFLIAYVWSAITVQLPLMEAGQDLFSTNSLVLFARRFLFIFALTLVFDIRDVQKDALTGTVTFPVKFGIEQTKRLALLSLFLFALLLPAGLSVPERLALGLSGVGAALVVWYAHETRSPYYFLILADGMMLVQFLLVWLVL